MDIKNFKFKKQYGQNFLIDKNITTKIANIISNRSNSLVIEIGCGDGRLTSKLCEFYNHVIAYDIDKEVEPYLLDNLKNYSNYEIIFDNFLKRDISKDVNKYNYNSLFIISNLPYYITTPIIEKIINSNIKVNEMIFMVQKEVGDRFLATVGDKNYNSLTVILNYYFNIKKEFIVNRSSFLPKPNVDSVVMSFENKNNKIKLLDEKQFLKLVKDSFTFKRKTIRNNLKDYDLIVVEEVLQKYNFNLNVRAEQLNYEIFCDLANKLFKKSI